MSSVLTMSKSARVITSVDLLAELLLGFKSSSRPVTVALLVIVPVVPALTLTTIVTVAAAPFARVPSEAVTTPLLWVTVPCELLADWNVTPAGSGSVAVTPVAVVPVEFVTVSV